MITEKNYIMFMMDNKGLTSMKNIIHRFKHMEFKKEIK